MVRFQFFLFMLTFHRLTKDILFETVHMSVCWSVWLHICLSICLSTHLKPVTLDDPTTEMVLQNYILFSLLVMYNMLHIEHNDLLRKNCAKYTMFLVYAADFSPFNQIFHSRKCSRKWVNCNFSAQVNI